MGLFFQIQNITFLKQILNITLQRQKKNYSSKISAKLPTLYVLSVKSSFGRGTSREGWPLDPEFIGNYQW